MELLEQLPIQGYRQELKFALPGADPAKIRALLRGFRRLRFKHDVSLVRSLYFDDARLSACKENLASVDDRLKIRLRWYDSRQPHDEFYAELKQRVAGLTRKRRVRVRIDAQLFQLSYKCLHRQLLAVLPPAFSHRLTVSSDPVCLVEYRREHFASPHGPLRLTLDTALKAYPQKSSRPGLRFPVSMAGMVVLEAKAPAGHPLELARVLAPLQLRPTRYSKYVEGCRGLGLI